jgi:hypothetical protein
MFHHTFKFFPLCCVSDAQAVTDFADEQRLELVSVVEARQMEKPLGTPAVNPLSPFGQPTEKRRLIAFFRKEVSDSPAEPITEHFCDISGARITGNKHSDTPESSVGAAIGGALYAAFKDGPPEVNP